MKLPTKKEKFIDIKKSQLPRPAAQDSWANPYWVNPFSAWHPNSHINPFDNPRPSGNDKRKRGNPIA